MSSSPIGDICITILECIADSLQNLLVLKNDGLDDAVRTRGFLVDVYVDGVRAVKAALCTQRYWQIVVVLVLQLFDDGVQLQVASEVIDDINKVPGTLSVKWLDVQIPRRRYVFISFFDGCESLTFRTWG